jgi:leucyl-tRNA synthetase
LRFANNRSKFDTLQIQNFVEQYHSTFEVMNRPQRRLIVGAFVLDYSILLYPITYMDYNHQEIEKKWQEKWKNDGIYNTKDKGKDNEYILVEFAYPSGNLHVGHWYAFSTTDIYARYRRMTGKNVMFPMGFDAFGLPAENAAIKNNVNPREWTYKNIEYMTTQLESMGAMFDWDRKVVTSDPEYYKWTQWLFIQLFKKGLVYQDESLVNWCPSCKTVLANEQVIAGKCERCDSEIEQREMKEWKIKTTDYAEKLLEGLDKLDWPEHIKEAQRNWIGKSEGAKFKFEIRISKSQTNSKSEIPNLKQVEVFTTRPDTLYGVTYLVVAPEHKQLDELKDKISNWNEVEEYIKKAGNKSELERISDNKEKTGVKIEGLNAINMATGEEIPIFISDYVISSYGTGAVMAVPAHDQRDFEFAEEFDLPIKMVICPHYPKKTCPILDEAYLGKGHLVDSGKFDGLKHEDAIEKITKKFGEKTTNYKMRDWSVSRQRYWGCPIPLIHCDKCGVVPEENLPVLLPDLEDFTPRDDGKSPLAKVEDFVNTTCPKCGGEGHRETDTLDTFVDSSWYFLRYCDSNNKEEFADKKKLKHWMPVDFYSGGSEHTTMHLLYARFWHKALHDLKLVKEDEPFTQRLNRGLILGPDGNKMSKSKGNVIDPDELVERLGADTVRAYLAFIGPYNEPGSYPWNANGVVGVRRFIERVVRLKDSGFSILDSVKESEKVKKLLHKTIKGVTEDYQNLKFNTGLSKVMTLTNLMEKENFSNETYETVLKLLAPIVPHISEELFNSLESSFREPRPSWRGIDNPESVHLQSWPEFDPKLAKDEEVEIVIQINGKVRGTLTVEVDSPENVVKQGSLALPGISKWLDGNEPKKVIFVPNKLINFVV